MFVHVVVRGKTARYEPKFEPNTLMLLRRLRCGGTMTAGYSPSQDGDVPRLSKTDEVTDKLKPTPLEMRHMTKVSLRHCVDAQAVTPTRTVPL
jgi:hypothetical protein